MTDDPSYDPIATAKKNPQSRALAIKAFCASCIGFPEPGWRAEIRGCTALECPLYSHRPYQVVRSEIIEI